MAAGMPCSRQRASAIGRLSAPPPPRPSYCDKAGGRPRFDPTTRMSTARRSEPLRTGAMARSSWAYKESDAMELYQLAAQGGYSAVRLIRQILSHGTPPDIMLRHTLRFRAEEPVVTELSALHIACARGHADVTTVMLQAQANPNLVGGHNLTPLHLAVKAPTKRGRRALCAVLLAHGADVNIENESGRTAIQAAEIRHGRRSRIACFLRSPPSPALLDAEAHDGDAFVPMRRRSRSAPHGLNARELEAFEMRLRQKRVVSVASEAVCVRSVRDADAKDPTELEQEVDDKSDCDERDVCGICLDDLEDADEEIWELPCPGHHCFHADCVRPWLRQSGACPACRRRMT